MKYLFDSSLRGFLACVLVLGLLQPFGIDRIEEGRIGFILGQSFCAFVSTWISVYISLKAFPRLQTMKGNGIWRVALRMLPTYVINAFLLTGALLSFNGWFNEGNLSAYWVNENGFHLYNYFAFLPNILVVSLVIYIGMLFVTQSVGLKDELNEMKELNRLLEERQEQEPEETPAAEEAQKCIIESSTNNITLEVNPKDIIYIESMSNYADICYLEEGETRHKTLRITMKQLRESLACADCLVSCHRAFIVNIGFIVSINTRPTGGYQLQIFGNDKQIPVARAYTDEIKTRLASKLANNS